MKMTIKLTERPIVYGDFENINVTLTIPKRYSQEAEALENLEAGLYSLEIKPKSKRKTISQNNYIWGLCSAIGDATRRTPLEVYKQNIRETSNYTIGYIKVAQIEEYGRIWASNGTGWFVEIADRRGDFLELRCYYGMSAWTKEQASLFIDLLQQDCRELGVYYEEWRERNEHGG